MENHLLVQPSPYKTVRVFRVRPSLICSTYGGRDCGKLDWYTHPLDRISGPKRFDFPLLIVRREPQVRDADVRSPFLLQDLEQDDNTISSSARGHRRRSQRKCSGSCRSLASVFRL